MRIFALCESSAISIKSYLDQGSITIEMRDGISDFYTIFDMVIITHYNMNAMLVYLISV